MAAAGGFAGRGLPQPGFQPLPDAPGRFAAVLRRRQRGVGGSLHGGGQRGARRALDAGRGRFRGGDRGGRAGGPGGRGGAGAGRVEPGVSRFPAGRRDVARALLVPHRRGLRRRRRVPGPGARCRLLFGLRPRPVQRRADQRHGPGRQTPLPDRRALHRGVRRGAIHADSLSSSPFFQPWEAMP